MSSIGNHHHHHRHHGNDDDDAYRLSPSSSMVWAISPPAPSRLKPPLSPAAVGKTSNKATIIPVYSKIDQFRESGTGEQTLCFRGRPARPEDVMFIRKRLEDEKAGRKTTKLIIMYCDLNDELLKLLLFPVERLTGTTTQWENKDGVSALTDRQEDHEMYHSDILAPMREIKLGLNSLGSRGAWLLSQSVLASSRTTLTKLSLSSNQIGCDGARAVAGMLSECTSLVYLDLSANGIMDEGATALGEALERNRSLKMLSLEANSIGEVGLRYLSEGVRKCPTMQALNLAYNVRLGNSCYPALAQSIRCHVSMREIALEGSEVSVYYRMLLRRRMNVLHSERTRILSVLVSPRHVRRLNHDGKCFVAQLPSELIRMVDVTLFDPKTGIAHAKLKSSTLYSLNNLTMFVILQALLCFWAFLGAVMINWI